MPATTPAAKTGLILPEHTDSLVEALVLTSPNGSRESIGQRLARLRKERGVTQKDLAAKLDLTQPFISQYERGDLRLHGDLIVRIAKALRVSADELLGLVPAKPGAVIRNRRLARRLQQIDKLSRRDQDAIVRTLEAFLERA